MRIEHERQQLATEAQEAVRNLDLAVSLTDRSRRLAQYMKDLLANPKAEVIRYTYGIVASGILPPDYDLSGSGKNGRDSVLKSSLYARATALKPVATDDGQLLLTVRQKIIGNSWPISSPPNVDTTQLLVLNADTTLDIEQPKKVLVTAFNNNDLIIGFNRNHSNPVDVHTYQDTIQVLNFIATTSGLSTYTCD